MGWSIPPQITPPPCIIKSMAQSLSNSILVLQTNEQSRRKIISGERRKTVAKAQHGHGPARMERSDSVAALLESLFWEFVFFRSKLHTNKRHA